MSEPKHTAGEALNLPWKSLGLWIDGNNGEMVAEVENDDHREYIVRACNSFPDHMLALAVVRMSMGWQYMSDETKALVNSAIAKAQPEGR